MNNQEFKIGQRVKVHEGWNIEEDIKYAGQEGKVTGVDVRYSIQPCITVRYPDGISTYVYPSKDNTRGFKVEIVE